MLMPPSGVAKEDVSTMERYFNPTEASSLAMEVATCDACRQPGEYTEQAARSERFSQATNPDFARWCARMAEGRFESAWKINDATGNHWPSAHQLWNGKELRGADVLLRCLHGLGDAVQMLQFAPALASLCRQTAYDVPAALRPLLPYFAGVGSRETSVSSHRFVEPEIEVEMMELPYLFRTHLGDLPLVRQYLRLPSGITSEMAERMGQQTRKRIGIVWAGGTWDKERWIPIDLLRTLVNDDRYEWWNLQGGDRAGEGCSLPLMDAASRCGDGILHLAATISQLDLVITIDSLAAHLAGALGTRCLVLLKQAADWRWLRNRIDSPWYPNITLIRQRVPGQWAGVMDEVRFGLNEWSFRTTRSSHREA